MIAISHYDIQNALFRDGFLSVRGYDKELMYEAYNELSPEIFGFTHELDGSCTIYVKVGQEMNFYIACAKVKDHWRRLGL